MEFSVSDEVVIVYLPSVHFSLSESEKGRGHTMIASKGASTMTYPDKKVVKLCADFWICQGQVTHPPRIEVRKAPLLMLRYLGKMNAQSFEVAIELVEMLVPKVARPLVVSDYF